MSGGSGGGKNKLSELLDTTITSPNNNDVLTYQTGSGTWEAIAGGGGGETNTASNVNVGGVGVFKQKTGVDLEFRGANAADAKITVSLDAANNEIDIGFGSVSIDDLSDVSLTAAAKGDLLVHNGSNWVDLTVGSNDQVLTADSAEATGIKWAAAGGGLPSGSRGEILAYSEVAADWVAVNADTGSFINEDCLGLFVDSTWDDQISSGYVTDRCGDVAHPGQWRVNTGTSTTGRCMIRQSNCAFNGSDGSVEVTYVVLTDTNLSDGTDTYTIVAGLCDNINGAAQTDSVFFRYTDAGGAAPDGNWECVTESGGTETATDTSNTVSSNTWYTLQFVINDDWSEVKFYIDGTLEATHTTNIPTLSQDAGGINIGIFKSAGTNNRYMNVDCMSALLYFPGGR